MSYRMILVALVCCAPADPAVTSVTEALAPAATPAAATVFTGTCATAAIPDDGVDDTTAIQAALAAQGCADLLPGRYDLAVPPAPRGVSVLSVGAGQRLRGVGPATVLAFTGDAAGADLHGIEVTGDNPIVQDLLVDTTHVTGASEQTHAIQVTGPASNVAITGVAFNHMTTPDGGDCIKVVGYAAGREVRGLLVQGPDAFLSCNRSGVGIHGGLIGLRLLGNAFYGVAKVDVASEDGDDKSDWTIAGNTFLEADGGHALAIEITNHVAITGNVIVGRSVYTYNANGLSITGNTILQPGAVDASALLQVEAASSDVAISGNVLSRPSGVAGDVIELDPHDTGTPSQVMISGNRVLQGTESPAIRVYGAGVTIADNDITMTSTTGASFAIDIGGMTTQASGIMVTGNRVAAGALLAMLRISGAHFGIGRMSVIGNLGTGSPTALRCESAVAGAAAAGITGPVISYGNNWGANGLGCPLSSGN